MTKAEMKMPHELPMQKTLEKIIYASRKGSTKVDVQKILDLEIETFLRNNPRYGFEKYGPPHRE